MSASRRSGPDPTQLPLSRIVYAVDKCLFTLEADELAERIAYTQAAQADAESGRTGRRLLDLEH